MVQIIKEILPEKEPSFLEQLGLTGLNLAQEIVPAFLEKRRRQQEEQQQKFKEFQEEQQINTYLDKLGLGEAKNLPKEYRKQILSQKIKEQYAPKKEEPLKKEPPAKKPISYSDISKVWSTIGIGARQKEQLGPEATEYIRQKALQYEETMDREAAISKATQEYLKGGAEQASPLEAAMQGKTPQEQIPEPTPEEQEGILAAGKKGLQNSISGRLSALAQGIPFTEYEKSVELNNPSFVNRFTKEFSKTVIGNMPFITAGGTLGAEGGAAVGALGGPFGAAAGGVIGGGAGAMALPAMMDTALTQYHEYLEKGGDKPFDAFVDGLAKTAKSGAEAGTEGAIFGILSKSMPMIKQIPGMESLFKKPIIGKAAEKVTKGTVESTGLLAAKSLAQQKLPSSQEIIDTVSQVIGFNLFEGLPSKAKETVLSKVKKSGIPPDQVAAELKSRVEKGEVKDTKDVVRVINDITKSYQGAEKEAGLGVIETLKKVKAPEPAKMAEMLAERPVEEAIEYEKKSQERKEKPLTEKETAKREKAAQETENIQRKIEKINEEIPFLEEQSTRGTAENQKLSRIALKSKKAELIELESKQTKLKSIAEKGVEPFSEEALREPIKKHIEELEIAAKDPSSATAQEWKQMFVKDKKHVDDFAKILEKGMLPEPQFKDRYIKTLEVYQKAYDNMINDLNSKIQKKSQQFERSVKANEHNYDLKKEIEYLKRKSDLLAENYKINQAKVGKQKDKLAQLYELKKPGSALTRQILKNMRKDIVDLQKEFIKQRTELDAFEKKTETVAKEQIKENTKLFKEYAENPSKDILKKIAEQNDISVEKLEEAADIAKTETRNAFEKLKQNATKEEFDKAFNKIIEKLNEKYAKLPKLVKTVIWSIAATHIQDIGEKLLDFKLPLSVVGYILPGTQTEKVLRSVFSNYYKKWRKNNAIEAKKREYKKLKTPGDKIAFDKKLADNFTKKERDYIIGK